MRLDRRGELNVPGLTISASTVKKIRSQAGLGPAGRPLQQSQATTVTRSQASRSPGPPAACPALAPALVERRVFKPVPARANGSASAVELARAFVRLLCVASTGQAPRSATKKAPSRAFFYGRYWARTSDPQLVEPAPSFALVPSRFLVCPPLQGFQRLYAARVRAGLHPLHRAPGSTW